MHRDWVPHAAEFLGTDFEDGADVDILADVHRLSRVVGEERLTSSSCSTFEHLKYPTVAAHEVMKALKVGGCCTSRPTSRSRSTAIRRLLSLLAEALASLFGTTMGLEIVATNNDFPAQIYSRRLDDSHRFLAFLNTTLWGRSGRDAGQYLDTTSRTSRRSHAWPLGVGRSSEARSPMIPNTRTRRFARCLARPRR